MLLSEDNTKTQGALAARFERATQCSPCVVFLRHIDCLVQQAQFASQRGVFPTNMANSRGPLVGS